MAVGYANRAAAIIERRAILTPEFKAGEQAMWDIATAVALLFIQDGDEAGMKYLKANGGWTRVLTQRFEATVGDATIPGSFDTAYPIKAALGGTTLVADVRIATTRYIQQEQLAAKAGN